MAEALTCKYGRVDHVAAALRALRAAQAGVTKAEQRARELVAAAHDRVDQERDGLHKAIVADYQAGGRVGDLAKRSEYNRETIRRILRRAGVEPD